MRNYIFKIKHVYRVCILTLLPQSPEKCNFVIFVIIKHNEDYSEKHLDIQVVLI